VLDAGSISPQIRRSRASRWRAGVLIAVHVAIAAHVLQWWYSGSRTGVRATVSPVEPSEAMYTLEEGLVNAGFVFFIVAIVSTFIFGRIFCGWGCHVVALQDLCSWIMERLGVRPKPFRSRLLLWVPLGLALYMFVWPTVRREVVQPAFAALDVPMPVWLGRTAPRPAFEPAFIVEDFWATFPPWYVAVPFLLVCGFGAVYFLGSKGFCTYGCPYGGFFGPADLVAAGKIVVNERCNGCGHCTAVCTSNVRVHEEVRDFGKVVNPGCMKCLDCVSVCPNHALAFRFAPPTVVTRPRDDEAAKRVRARRAGVKHYDLTRREEWAVAAVFMLMLMAFRGMLGQVPLLMAVGLAGIGAFSAWKLWRLLTWPNVRLQNLQLKVKGRWTWAGRVFAAATVLLIAVAAWSGVVRWHLWTAGLIDARITTPPERVLAAGYVPDPEVRGQADRALEKFRRADSWSRGGIGWPLDAGTNLRVSWLHAVGGRLDEAERALLRAMEQREPAPALLTDLSRLMYLQGKSAAEAVSVLRGLAERWPRLDRARIDVAMIEFASGRHASALEEIDRLLSKPVVRVSTLREVADVLVQVGEAGRAVDVLRRAERVAPADAAVQGALGVALALTGRHDQATTAIRRAEELAPRSAHVAGLCATAWMILNRPGLAEACIRRAIDVEPENAHHWIRLGDVLEAVGRTRAASEARSRAKELMRSGVDRR
jgi:polyferredoxin/Flp pilus assembly protein TadD